MSDPKPLSFTPPTVAELGQILEAYEIKNFIAQGGMGAVYHARQRSLDREVAIKILPRELGADPAFFRSFETEARAMAKLNHPNLIGVYDSGCVDGMLFLAMELVVGESLYHKYYHQKVEPAEAARLVKGICHGLAHAHEHDVVHRDIKPANIIISAKGEPKIGDFGLAQQAGRGDGSGVVMGTPGYLAPEVIAKPHTADRRADLYAVGVILYELLTGQLPGNPVQLPSALSGCDPLFDKIFRRATHPSPTFRYPSAETFAAALDEVPPAAAGQRAGRTILTGPTSPPPATPVRRPATPAAPASAAMVKRPAAPVPAAPAPIAKRAPQQDAPLAKRAVAAETPLKRAAATPPANLDSKLIPANSPKADAARAAAAPVEVTVAGGGLIRNILIIIGLSVGIYFAWGLYEQKSAATRLAEEKHYQEVEARNKAKLEAEKARLEQQRQQARSAEPPKPRPTEPATQGGETPMESLARLKAKLAGGARDELPLGSFGFGEHRFFLVTKPLGWREAREFAEDHGGHLAILPTTMAIEMTSGKLPAETTAWIGGGISGRGQWNWLDGSPLTRPSGSGTFATLSSLGLVLAHPAAEKHPFLIQWKTEGTALPATLADNLKRAADGLAASKAAFPTGTEPFENRYFLLVQRPTTWKDADAMARMAGGNLAVPSNRTELAWIQQHLAEQLPGDGVCWFAGRRSGDIWSWTTTEPWVEVKWSAAPPANATALAVNATGEWLALDPETRVSSFLIEWSRDAPAATGATGATTPAATGGDALPSDLKVLKSQATTVCRQYLDARDTALGENSAGFRRDIDSWYRGLVHSEQDNQEKLYEKLKALVGADKRLADGSKLDDPPAKVAKALDAYTAEQKEIDLEFGKKVMALREKFLARLTAATAAADNTGQSLAAKAIKAEMAAAGNDLPGFIKYLIEAN